MSAQVMHKNYLIVDYMVTWQLIYVVSFYLILPFICNLLSHKGQTWSSKVTNKNKISYMLKITLALITHKDWKMCQVKYFFNDLFKLMLKKLHLEKVELPNTLNNKT